MTSTKFKMRKTQATIRKSFMTLVALITTFVAVKATTDLAQNYIFKSKAAYQTIESSGSVSVPPTDEVFENYKKFNQIVSQVPIHQNTFYITYASKLSQIAVNLYLPDYSKSETDFKTWLSNNNYQNLPSEYFVYTLTGVTPTPAPVSTNCGCSSTCEIISNGCGLIYPKCLRNSTGSCNTTPNCGCYSTAPPTPTPSPTPTPNPTAPKSYNCICSTTCVITGNGCGLYTPRCIFSTANNCSSSPTCGCY